MAKRLYRNKHLEKKMYNLKGTLQNKSLGATHLYKLLEHFIQKYLSPDFWELSSLFKGAISIP